VHDAVYERLKARLLKRPLTPGQTLQIGPWAEELRVSSTPVREALTRLAAEGLILFAPKKGFFARTPTEAEIRGLYAANAALVSAAIDHAASSENREPWSALSGAAMPIVVATDELFLRIGRHSGLSELSERIQNLSERLRHVRLIECEVLGDAEKEVACMRSHVDSGQRAELRAAVGIYHETRLQNISQICRELLVRAFSSTGG
jgi:DNA-binding transcriptional MocR family regulator